MYYNIPLSSLRTFIEVSRLGSMKLTAEKMCITTGAVSQQIRQLEEHLGNKLFSRTGKKLILSLPGTHLRDAVARGFEDIENGWAQNCVMRPVFSQLVIAAVPVVAHRWLLPLLNSFQRQYPRISISLRVCHPADMLRSDSADICLSLESLPGEQLRKVALWSSEVIPVCSPELLDGRVIEKPEDLLDFPLLQNPYRNSWHEWFSSNGVICQPVSRGACFDDEFGLINAACLQQGIALVHERLIQDELESGRLVRLLPEAVCRQEECQFVSRESSFSHCMVQSFLGWLMTVSACTGHQG